MDFWCDAWFVFLCWGILMGVLGVFAVFKSIMLAAAKLAV